MVKYEEVIKNEDIFSIIINTIENKKNLINLLKTSKKFKNSILTTINKFQKKSINIYYPNNNKLKNNCFEIPKKSCLYKITDELINLDINNEQYKIFFNFIRNEYYKSYYTKVDNINSKKRFIDIIFIFWKGDNSKYLIPDKIPNLSFRLCKLNNHFQDNHIFNDFIEIENYIQTPLIEIEKNYLNYFTEKIRDYTYCNDYTKIFKYILNIDSQKYVACPPEKTIDWICDNKPVGIKLRVPFECLEIIPRNYCCSHNEVYCFCNKCTDKQEIFHKL